MRRLGRTKSEGFKKEDRIVRTEDFKRTMEKGAKLRSSHFIVFCFRRDGNGGARLGLSVSRKVGNAVCRNRWKRLIREVFRRKIRFMIPETDIVVMVRAVQHGETRRVLPKLNWIESELVGSIERYSVLAR